MEMVIDLHASEIDQLGSGRARLVKIRQRLIAGFRKDSLSLDIESPWLKRSLASCLGQTDGIEDAFRNLVFGCSRADFALADVLRSLRARGRDCQCEKTGADRQKTDPSLCHVAYRFPRRVVSGRCSGHCGRNRPALP